MPEPKSEAQEQLETLKRPPPVVEEGGITSLTTLERAPERRAQPNDELHPNRSPSPPPVRILPKFSHTRIASYLKASGLRGGEAVTEEEQAAEAASVATAVETSAASGTTATPAHGSSVDVHKRVNSLWTPDIWKRMLDTEQAPNSANSPKAGRQGLEPLERPAGLSPVARQVASARGEAVAGDFVEPYATANTPPPLQPGALPSIGEFLPLAASVSSSSLNLAHRRALTGQVRPPVEDDDNKVIIKKPDLVKGDTSQPTMFGGIESTPAIPSSSTLKLSSQSTKAYGAPLKMASTPLTGQIPTQSNVSAFIDARGMTYQMGLTGADNVDPMDKNFLTKHKKPDPQACIPLPSSIIIRVVIVLNLIFSMVYLWWRWNSTIFNIDTHFFGVSFLPVRPWAWTFYGVEICLIIAIWVGHTQRMFAVQRIKLTMDDIVREDDSVGYNSRIAILLPTNGEKLEVLMKALLGAISQRCWYSGLSRADTYRIIILDEKRRKAVLHMAAAVYALATMVRHPNIVTILQAEGVQAITAKGFYEWWKVGGGFARKHLYNDHYLNQACRLLEFMDEEAASEAGRLTVFSLEEIPDGIKGVHDATRKSKATTQATATSMLQAMNVGQHVTIEPGMIHTINSSPDLPTMIYYSRRDAGFPKVSPKAGNMNAALFPMDYPDDPPLIGNASILVVNDCRHQLQPDFLQRTVPYFFALDESEQQYSWAPVAFVQTPQRFDTSQHASDPLGNHAAIQYDIINHGKDGIGAVSSSGQGSLWRVAALKGVAADGKMYCKPTDRGQVGHNLGFRSEMLIEDTHTSIDMFRYGWTSRYVNEPGEHLSICTHQPNNINWRIKQVLRWHQGAVQLLFFKGLMFTSFGGEFPTIWHRIYAFDQATYYLQSLPGYMLLLMPVIYGVTGEPPFNTTVGEFFLFFTPFIVTAMLPTVISGTWRGVDSEKLTRDEQVWLSTTYVQIYAFVTMLYQHVTCKGTSDAWAVKAPTWPLFAVFGGEFIAIIGALVWVSKKGFSNYAPNFISVCVCSGLAIHSLWPMVSLHMGWKLPSMYYMKLLTWLFLGLFIVLIYYISAR